MLRAKRQFQFFSRHALLFGVFVALFVGALFVGYSVSAQTDTFGLSPVSQTIGLGGADIRIIIGKIIRAFLGLLGVIALGIVIYGGFVYMTAGGDESKVEQGRKILINGVIGLAIILSAFSITQFVLNRLQNAINGSNVQERCDTDPTYAANHPDLCGGSAHQTFCQAYPWLESCLPDAFLVKSITPRTDATNMNNAIVRVFFTGDVPTNSLAGAVKVFSGTSDITDTMQISYVDNNPRLIEARYSPPAQSCPTKGCLLPAGTYRVEVNATLKDRTNRALVTNNTNFPVSANFTVNTTDVVDDITPSLTPINLEYVDAGGQIVTVSSDGYLVAGKEYVIRSNMTDNSGAGFTHVMVSDGVESFPINSYDAPMTSRGSDATDSRPYQFAKEWYIPGSLGARMYTITLWGNDIDRNTTTTSKVFSVRPSHCANGVKDADETSVDAGGVDCGGNAGASCTADADCSQSSALRCMDSICTPYPRIDVVNPWDGAVGNLVTIAGLNFGNDPGEEGGLAFAGDSNVDGVVDKNDLWVETSPVNACKDQDLWYDQWMIGQIPELGGGIEFDGVSDSIRILNKPLLNPTDALTLELWWKPTKSFVGGNTGLIRKSYSSHTEPYYQYSLGVTGNTHANTSARGSFVFSIGFAEDDTTIGRVKQRLQIQTPPDVWTIDGGWYHIVGTYDKNTKKVALYVNGQLHIERTVVGFVMEDYGQPVYLSSTYDSTTKKYIGFTPGAMDEARIYNRALTPEEVMTHYASGKGVYGSAIESGLIAGWHMDEKNNILLNDYSGNKQYGVAFNNVRPAASEVASYVGPAAIRLTTAREYSDATNDDWGVRKDFTINTVVRPGLCSVEADGAQADVPDGATAGLPGTRIRARGVSFGSNQNSSYLSVGGVQSAVSSWEDAVVKSSIPKNMSAGRVGVTVTVNSETSNGVPFQILPTDVSGLIPHITLVSPSTTTHNSFVTISGEHFGEQTGFVYVADKPNALCTIDPAETCTPLTVTLPNYCGDTWKDTQIIAQIPSTLPVKTYYLIIERGDNQLHSKDIERLDVVAGDPRPSICSLTPESGPAPLPSGQSLKIRGINFTASPVVYFWSKESSQTSFDGWLKASIENPSQFDPNQSGTQIYTPIPVSDSGYSMQSGPIVVFANGHASNPVDYIVNSCIGAGDIPGLHCCTTGGDAGLWKTDSYVCEGETRDAGYVWRFTTGIIPRVPYVLEECRQDSEIYSPSPRLETVGNFTRTDACLNTLAEASFSIPVQGISEDTVKVFHCGQDDDPDCGNYIDTAVSVVVDPSTQSVSIHPTEDDATGNTDWLPETWYRVALTKGIASTPQSIGVSQVASYPLSTTRPLDGVRINGQDVAYYYDFKTASANVHCTLVGAGIQPPRYTTSLLGLVQHPADETLPYYYRVWGKGSQSCSIIDVSDLAWVWNVIERPNDAKVFFPPSVYTFPYTLNPTSIPTSRDKAVVEALQHTAPDMAVIEASFETEEEQGNADTIEILPDVAEPTPSLQDTVNALPWIDELGGSSRVIRSADDITTILGSYTNNSLNFIEPVTFEIEFTIDETIGTSSNSNPLYIVASNGGLFRMYYQDSARQFCIKTYWSSAVTWCTTVSVVQGASVHVVLTWGDGTLKVYEKDVVMARKLLQPLDSDYADNLNNDYDLTVGGYLDADPLDHTILKLRVLNQALSSAQAQSLFDDPTPEVPPDSAQESAIIGPSTPPRVSATSDLIVDLANPHITKFEPNCSESCINASISAEFNQKMVVSTYQSGIKLFRCDTANCVHLTPKSFTVDTSKTDSYQVRINPTGNLDPNTFYKVSFNGENLGENLTKAICAQGSYYNPELCGKPLATKEWVFRTKADGSPCAVNRLDVQPIRERVGFIGAQSFFSSTPISSPDECSAKGQRLNPWEYGYAWSVANPLVARVSDLKNATLSPSSQCSPLSCLPLGSTISTGVVGSSLALCGNGILDPGEDCDIAGSYPNGECTTSCLFSSGKTSELLLGTARPITQFDASAVGVSWCGDGVVTAGEACDIGISNTASLGGTGLFAPLTSLNSSGLSSKYESYTVPRTLARYIQIFIPGNSAGNISEIKIFENTTLHTPQGVIASPVAGGETANSPSKAIDSNVSTRWEQEGTNVWLIVDLGSPKPVNKIQIAWYQGDSRTYTFDILSSVFGPAGVRTGCTNSCTHTGTPLSGVWCLDRTDAECASAISVCGNGQLEERESCEIILENNVRKVLARTFTTDIVGERSIIQEVGRTELQTGRPSTYCTPLCVLQNVCDQPTLRECVVGTPGCTDGCTFAGSSPLYPENGLCGDGSINAGEYPLCENNSATLPMATISGQSPQQIVTALGNGPVNPQTLSQETSVIATLYTDSKVGGNADYALQCGYEEFAEKKDVAYNNCQQNADNGKGVGVNSCCYDRPMRQEEYPVHSAGFGGTEPVCRNTFISVSFDQGIDSESLPGNILVASGHEDPEYICPRDQFDVSDRVNAVLGNGSAGDVAGDGVIAHLWNRIKGFFLRLFGGDAFANHVVVDMSQYPVWCSGGVTTVPKVITTIHPTTSVVASEIIMNIDSALDPDTVYAIVLRGGKKGILDVRGVGIKNPENTNRDDVWVFKTMAGDSICRLDEVTVTPDNKLFQIPGSEVSFSAVAHSTNGRLIQPIPNVYNWTWKWGPDNQVFQIPKRDTLSSTRDIAIVSNNLEGHITGVVSARVVTDIFPTGNQLNAVFMGTTELTAKFCVNIWPKVADDETWHAYEDPVYHVSFSYCADAGNGTTLDDDLPVLDETPKVDIDDPTVLGGRVIVASGVCNETGVRCSEDTDCGKKFVAGQATTYGGQTDVGLCSYKSGTTQFTYDSVPGSDLILSCRINEDCAGNSAFVTYATARGSSEADILCNTTAVSPTQLACIGTRTESEILQKSIFFNPKNVDAFGVQIFKNEERLSAGEWFRERFGGATAPVPTTIAGYDAVTDGSSMYINALNIDPQTKKVYSNIYLLSLNDTAQGESRQMFGKILESLQFNTNMTDYQYCGDGQGNVETFVSKSCTSDFDCIGANKKEMVTQGVAGACTVDSQGQWVAQNTSDVFSESVQFNGVDFVDSQIGYMAVSGISDSVFKTTNGGLSWSALPKVVYIEETPVTTYRDVDFLDQNRGVMIGSRQTILYTSDGGQTWANKAPNDLITGALNDVVFDPSGKAWVVGSGGKVLESLNQGQLWTDVDVESTTHWNRIFFVNAEHAWIVGDSNTVRYTIDAGASWELLPLDSLNQSSILLKDVYFADANNGWIVGSPRYFARTIDGGETWTSSFLPEGNYTPMAVRALNDKDVWVVGTNTTVLHSSDGGTTWTQDTPMISLGSPIDFQAMQIIPNNRIIAVGSSGAVMVHGGAPISCVQATDCEQPNVCVGAVEERSIDHTASVCEADTTKFLRDWRRLHDVEEIQNTMGGYYARMNGYPPLNAGTYRQMYTNSRWPSWNQTLGKIVGTSLPQDPLNTWKNCEDNPIETCWNPDTSEFVCPEYASVYEMSVAENAGTYALHVPFEYFTDEGVLKAQFGGANNFIPNIASLTTSRGCVPLTHYSPFNTACGNGIVNPGEQCDPPNTTRASATSGTTQCPTGTVSTATCNVSCQWEYTACQVVSACGNGIVELGEACDDGALNGTYGNCAGPKSFAGAQERACTELHPAYCGNSEKDFVDSNKNGYRDNNETGSEFCDYSGIVNSITLPSVHHQQVTSELLNGGGISFGGWFKMDSTSINQTMTLMSYHDTSRNEYGAVRWQDDGSGIADDKIVFRYNNSADGSLGASSALWYSADKSFVNTESDWHHVMATIDDTTYTINIFVDGTLLFSRTQSPTQTLVGLALPRAGGWFTVGGLGFGNTGVDSLFIGGAKGFVVQAGVMSNTDVQSLFLEQEQLVKENGGGIYHQQKELSCSWNCQAPGGYCGDGIVQKGPSANNPYEQCDDGNTNNFDGCSQYCQADNLACKAGDPVFAIENNEKTNILFSKNSSNTQFKSISACTANTTGQQICAGYGLTCDKVISRAESETEFGLLSNSDIASCLTPINDSDDVPEYYVLTCNGVYTNPIVSVCGNNKKEGTEQCDDGNLANGDGCSKTCLFENAPRCGDGIAQTKEEYPNMDKNKWEVCDTGTTGVNANGKVCSPTYGQSCTYCASDCKSILTVDAVAYCGDGKIDFISQTRSYEVCEQGENGVVLIPPPNVSLSCLDRGQYQCTNSCTEISNDCFSCGVKTLNGTIPKLKYLNPVTGNIYETGGAGVNTIGLYKQSGDGAQFLTRLLTYGTVNPSSVESNPSCTDEYVIYFNATSESDIEDRQSASSFGDFFEYPVHGEIGEIKNEMVISEPVPEGTFRVVVRWTDAENALDGNFGGAVFNDFINHGQPILFADMSARSLLCRIFTYVTSCSDKQIGGIYVHRKNNSEHVFIQSFTIDTTQSYAGNYGFAVSNLGGKPMPQFWDSNLTVEVYTYHPDQHATDSIYKPTHTFSIKDAKGTSSNLGAQYWQPFNIVYEAGSYSVKPVNSIESTSDEVKLNIPVFSGIRPISTTNLFLNGPAPTIMSQYDQMALATGPRAFTTEPTGQTDNDIFVPFLQMKYINGNSSVVSSASCPANDAKACYESLSVLVDPSRPNVRGYVDDYPANVRRQIVDFNRLQDGVLYRYLVRIGVFESGNKFVDMEEELKKSPLTVQIGLGDPTNGYAFQASAPIADISGADFVGGSIKNDDALWYVYNITKSGNLVRIQLIDRFYSWGETQLVDSL